VAKRLLHGLTQCEQGTAQLAQALHREFGRIVAQALQGPGSQMHLQTRRMAQHRVRFCDEPLCRTQF
jgi:hypothetical protein